MKMLFRFQLGPAFLFILGGPGYAEWFPGPVPLALSLILRRGYGQHPRVS